MLENNGIKELKELAKEYTILYVEDNQGLQDKAVELFKKFFPEVIRAENGEEGLKLFKELRPRIVITDIRMPVMDGLEMSRKIKKISPKTKIIITSAFDETQYLFEAINIGIFRYLKKPLGIDDLTTVLLDGLKELKLENEDDMFNSYLKNIFNNQKNLLMLYNNKTPVIANETLLKFFNVDNLEEFISKYKSIGDNFLEHSSFLYNSKDRNWFDEAVENPENLYNVKMYDKDGQTHHFVFKMTHILEKDSYYLISLDDITDLELLRLYDEKSTRKDTIKFNKKAIIDLLQTIQRNNSKVKLHNFYKGISITNEGIVHLVDDNKVEFQSSYLQQKGAQNEKQVILSSDFFPLDILCESVKRINFDNQIIEATDLRFIETSPRDRASVRLTPDESHTASMFYQDRKFGDGIEVIDISLEAVRLSMYSIPAGFKLGEKVHVDLVFTINKKHLIINSEVEVFRIEEKQRKFYVVLTFNHTKNTKNILTDYIAQRQLELIREFKGLQYA